MKKINPFRELEVHLQLEKIEEEWETAKNIYNDTSSAESANELLKISLEKIKLLSEMYVNTYKA